MKIQRICAHCPEFEHPPVAPLQVRINQGRRAALQPTEPAWAEWGQQVGTGTHGVLGSWKWGSLWGAAPDVALGCRDARAGCRQGYSPERASWGCRRPSAPMYLSITPGGKNPLSSQARDA